MSESHHIRNPFEMAVQGLSGAASDASRIDPSRVRPAADAGPVAVRHITTADLRDALRQGFSDLAVTREDVVFAALIYPIAGLVLAEIFLNHNWLPLIFPLASGFALLGPLAAVGLYEISRRREQGLEVSWADAFGVLRSHALGSIIMVGLVLLALFGLWLMAAKGIYTLTLGPEQPHSLVGFVRDVVGTSRGWALIVIGMGVGFLFAVVALAIGVVSFPLLLDREVGFETALWTSARASRYGRPDAPGNMPGPRHRRRRTGHPNRAAP